MSEKELENVICNYCGADNYRSLFNKGRFNIVKCNSCGLVYTNPRIVQSSLKNIYEKDYYKSENSLTSGYDDYFRERPMIEATFNMRIEFILKKALDLHDVKDPIILDIGCAMGYLLDIFRRRGWRTEGIELSEFAAQYAREELKLNVQSGALTKGQFPQDRFSLITSWDVIEHCPDPVGDLREIRSILMPGGYLSIITPNRGSLHAKFVGKNWVEYEKPEEHIYFFDEKILGRILGKLGFKVIASTTAGKYVTMSFALRRLTTYLAIMGKVINSLNSKTLNKYLYVDPKDKMFVLAQKV